VGGTGHNSSAMSKIDRFDGEVVVLFMLTKNLEDLVRMNANSPNKPIFWARDQCILVEFDHSVYRIGMALDAILTVTEPIPLEQQDHSFARVAGYEPPVLNDFNP